MSHTSGIYLHSVVSELGERCVTVEETSQQGLLHSDPAHFREAGFAHQRICLPETTCLDLAQRAAMQLQGQLQSVSGIVYHSALAANAQHLPYRVFEQSREIRHLAEFPVSHLQDALGLEQAFTLGISQQACTGFVGALRVARALLSTEPDLAELLCVTSDRVPEGGLRESTYNPLADAALACLVGRERQGFQILAVHQITNGALATRSADELVGSYFTYTHRVITQALAKSGLGIEDIAWIVPQNLARAAWQVMSSLLGFDSERVLCPSVAEVGHLVSGCNFLNLQRGLAESRFRPGERVLLPVAGYGLNWQCLVLEKV